MTPSSALQANRYTLAYRDMEDVKRYISAYLELDAFQRQCANSRYFDHCEAALVAAIVAYSRCFTASKSKGKAAKLLKKTDFACLTENNELSKLHDLVLEKRHTTVAHSDWAEHNTELLEVRGKSVFRRISVPKLTRGVEAEQLQNLAALVKQEALARSHTLDTSGAGPNAA